MPSGSLRIGNAADFVELQVLEIGTVAAQSEGDLTLRVAVASDGFTGTHDKVYISPKEWCDFVLQLRVLERERRGGASLIAMSPDQFELHLNVSDRRGNLAATGFLSRYHWLGFGEAKRSTVWYSARVNAEMTRTLVDSIEALSNDGFWPND